MYLISLTANRESFKKIIFKKSGVNFILARQSEPEKDAKGLTYNGVGKSLIVTIIHFCLGSQSIESFKSQLPGWYFYLVVEIGGRRYTLARSTENQEVIEVDDEEYKLTRFRKWIEPLAFSIEKDLGSVSFRSLIPFFLRPDKDAYASYDRPVKVGNDYQRQLLNGFLLGIDPFLAQEKMELRKQQEKIKDSVEILRNDDTLKSFFSAGRDAKLELLELNDRIGALQRSLSEFSVAEDYYEIKEEADKISEEVFSVSNDLFVLRTQLSSIEESLRQNLDIKPIAIERVYNEAGFFFPESIKRTLTELESFYDRLHTNRRRRLQEQKRILTRELEAKTVEKTKNENNLDNKLQYLGSHKAIEVYIQVSSQLGDLVRQRDRVENYDRLFREYDRQGLQTKEKMLTETIKTNSYLKEIDEHIETLRQYFRSLAKRVYPKAVSGITVSNNDGENQIRYNIEARIESDRSDGINNVKIFCYDLAILLFGRGHAIDFLFHDSRIFDGVDDRQISEIIKIVNETFGNSPKQYIATINQNQAEVIRRLEGPETYQKYVEDNVILNLTDDTVDGKLLGVNVDLS